MFVLIALLQLFVQCNGSMEVEGFTNFFGPSRPRTSCVSWVFWTMIGVFAVGQMQMQVRQMCSLRMTCLYQAVLAKKAGSGRGIPGPRFSEGAGAFHVHPGPHLFEKARGNSSGSQVSLGPLIPNLLRLLFSRASFLNGSFFRAFVVLNIQGRFRPSDRKQESWNKFANSRSAICVSLPEDPLAGAGVRNSLDGPCLDEALDARDSLSPPTPTPGPPFATPKQVASHCLVSLTEAQKVRSPKICRLQFLLGLFFGFKEVPT